MMMAVNGNMAPTPLQQVHYVTVPAQPIQPQKQAQDQQQKQISVQPSLPQMQQQYFNYMNPYPVPQQPQQSIMSVPIQSAFPNVPISNNTDLSRTQGTGFPQTANEMHRQAQIYANNNGYTFVSLQSDTNVTLNGKQHPVTQYGYLTPSGFIPSFNTVHVDNPSEFATLEKSNMSDSKDKPKTPKKISVSKDEAKTEIKTCPSPTVVDDAKKTKNASKSLHSVDSKLKSDEKKNGQKSKGQIMNAQLLKRRYKNSSNTFQSNYRGVSWDKSMKAWRTKINSVHIGYFDDEKDAARAYDEAALALRGGKASALNFPDTDYSKLAAEGNWMKYQSKRNVLSRGTSKYRGVLWDRAAKSWRAKIKSLGKTKYLGVYSDEGEAARAYDKAAVFLHGDKARLNFPEEQPSLINNVMSETKKHMQNISSSLNNVPPAEKNNNKRKNKEAEPDTPNARRSRPSRNKIATLLTAAQSQNSGTPEGNTKKKDALDTLLSVGEAKRTIKSAINEFQNADLQSKQELWTLLHRVNRKASQTKTDREKRKEVLRENFLKGTAELKEQQAHDVGEGVDRFVEADEEGNDNSTEDASDFLDAIEKLQGGNKRKRTKRRKHKKNKKLKQPVQGQIGGSGNEKAEILSELEKALRKFPKEQIEEFIQKELMKSVKKLTASKKVAEDSSSMAV